MELVFDTSVAFDDAFNAEKVVGHDREVMFSQIGRPLLGRFREYIIKVFKEVLGEVYYVNGFRTNVVPLINLQERLIAYFDGNYRVKIDLDEDMIVFKDKTGEPVYRIKKGYGDEGPVEYMDQYWRTPINGLREDEYYTREITERVDYYLSHTFQKMIRTQIVMNLKQKGGAYGFKK